MSEADKYFIRKQRHRKWMKVVGALSCVVVFCTTYALILPAITMENTKCGLEEHTHTEECYEQADPAGTKELACSLETLGVHSHTESCYDDDGELECEETDFVIHTHDELCYDQNGELICPLPEIEAHAHTDDCYESGEETVIEEGHKHTKKCYTEEPGELICGLEESEGHIHSEDCYTDTDVLICEQEESEGHTHGDDCYDEDGNLICEQDETEGHAHDESCYETERKLTCGQDETEGHTHSDDCYAKEEVLTCEKEEQEEEREESEPELICDKEEIIPHTHTEECYEEDELVCGQQEILEHQHTEECKSIPEDASDLSEEEEDEPEYVCGLDEHVHGDDCYDEEGNLICGLEEHTHTEDCKPEEEETTPEVSELRYEGEDYIIRVQYGPESGLPEGVELKVEEISVQSEDYHSYYEQSVDTLAAQESPLPETLVFARFFDIQFLLDGEKLEPEAPVAVKITYTTPIETNETANYQTIHFAEGGPELLETDMEEEELGETSFTHTQDSFSVVGSLVTMSYSDNDTDIGPSVLPVDYYVYIDNQWTCVGSTRTGWYGDYSTGEWLNTNRDCITVEQAASVLGAYGFDSAAGNAALQLAYQRKETDQDPYLHCDTESYADAEKGGVNVIPLARNTVARSGYNLYFLPGNTNTNFSSSLNDVNKKGSYFYTVSIYDPNHLAYGEGETTPETQIIRGGNSVSVTVKALPDGNKAGWQCMGPDWNVVSEGVGRVENSDGSITFSIEKVGRPMRIMPLAVDLGTASAQTVHYYVYLDGKWIEAGTTSMIYKSDHFWRYYVTAVQVESVLASYGFRSENYDYTSGQGNSLVHQFAYGNTDTIFWSDNDSIRLSDGSWAVGLSGDDTGYNLYYLPVNTESFADRTPDGFAQSGSMTGNRFYSVTVRDDSHAVYTEGELSDMWQAVREDGTAEIKVWNGEGVIWSVVGKDGAEVEATRNQSGGYTTFQIKNMSQPVEVVATRTNPAFIVQYYANIPRPVSYGDTTLTIIDTSGGGNGTGGILPTNGGNMATRNLGLKSTGRTADNSNGDRTTLYEVNTAIELTRLYTEETFEYEHAPALEYFNKLEQSEGYQIAEIWVLKTGKDGSSTNPNDWDIYTYSAENTAFTNEAAKADSNTILIADGAVLRLVYNTGTADYHNGTTFYDYNISSGQNDDGSWRTGITGINSSANYRESNNGERNWNSYCDVLAFGNANCGTGMSSYPFDGGPLNKYNSKNANYEGCTFGLAQRLNQGRLMYNEWLVTPNLFNDGDAYGKQTYSDSSLIFDRVGDTYTLSAAILNNSNGRKDSIDGLQYFNNPSPRAGTIYDYIYTNNFWPMDTAAGRTDPLFGQDGNDVPYRGFDDVIDTSNSSWPWIDKSGTLPESDDGLAHNCFFGMNFSISFTMTQDYVGPLEYYFFGDDDMWVFLDGRLICDIGGVHSSIGEYVNLWDYIPQGESTRTHTLDFFYTERGASGSTCYMSFTLPSVTSSTISQDTGSLQIKKTVDDPDGADFGEEEFEFQVNLGETGNELDQTFSYHKTDGTFGTIKSGHTIVLKSGETAEINGIPAGTRYTVTELTRGGYKTTVNSAEGYIASGTIENGGIQTADFVNTPYYELPSTGGPGTLPYTFGGFVVMAGAVIYDMNRRRRRGGSITSLHIPGI